MERKQYSQHPDRKIKVISEGNRRRNGEMWRQIVVISPNGKTVKGKPAFISQTYHERIA